jgi:hypothetical protein
MSKIDVTSGEKKFVVGVPFGRCHGCKCDLVAERAGEILNEILGGGTLIVRQDDGSMDRTEFESEVSKVALPLIEVRSHDSETMHDEDFTILHDTHRNRTVININEKFEGDEENLRLTMELIAIELR